MPEPYEFVWVLTQDNEIGCCCYNGKRWITDDGECIYACERDNVIAWCAIS